MFTSAVSQCPACLSRHFTKDIFRSHKRLLSEPGLPHSECQNCHTVFLNPMPTEKELNEFYHAQKTEDSVVEVAKSSAMRVLDEKRREYFESNRVAPLRKFLKPGANIFDVGCGVGAFVYSMKHAGFETSGCDLSAVSVQAGREVLSLSEKELFKGDIHSLPNMRFDLVTLWTVIEHLLRPEDYLKELREKYLRPDGHVLVEFPTTDSLMYRHLGEYFKWVMPPYHLNLFSHAGMESLLSRCGFQVVYTHHMPRNWYFFESAAKKVGLTDQQVKEVEKIAPGLSLEVDKIFDDISLEARKSSSLWMLARRI